jgi:hypothetical protein
MSDQEVTQAPQVHNERIYNQVWKTPEEAAAEIDRLLCKCERLQMLCAERGEEISSLTRRLDDWASSTRTAMVDLLRLIGKSDV